MEDLTGQRLGDYQLLRLLGRGAMASVYLADQESLARRVAVKVLSADLARNEAAVERFQHEARSAASLVHANIVQVYEVGRGDGRHYLVQEYVPGGTLGQLARRDGRLSAARGLAVMWQVASALTVAADRGLVHRDIKPDNLMLDRSGAVKVADFGLARLAESDSQRTQEGVTMGTPLYMSPEQVQGETLDTRSDLYSLGATAYHLLAGEPPFTGDTPLAVAVRRLTVAPEALAERRPDLPNQLVGVVDRLMAREPGERYGSPRQLLAHLREIAKNGERDGWAAAETIDAATLTGSLSQSAPGVAAEPEGRTGQLAEAMRAEAALHRRMATGRAWWWAIAAGVVVGVVAASVMGRKTLVPAGAARAIEKEASVEAQLYRAKLVGSADGWRAVESYFPDAPEFYHLLALRGLAADRLVAERPRQAIAPLERLAARETDFPDFALFGQAGLVVAHAQQGSEQSARAALGALPADPLPRLRSQSPAVAAAFVEAVRRIGASTR